MTLINATFNKGNALDQPPLTFPMREIPSYENQLHSPQALCKKFKPLTDTPVIELEEVYEVAQAVRITMMKGWPVQYAKKWDIGNGIAEPLKAANVMDSYDLARLVGMDKPTDIYYILDSFIKDQLGTTTHINQSDHVPFLEHTIHDMSEVAVLIELALQAAFAEKWFHGIARPEEVLAPYEVSLYPEGCPQHPSYPAGHGTVAGVVYAYLVYCYQLDGKSKKVRDLRAQLKLAARQFAHGRSFAGVHYGIDNEAGFNLGVSIFETKFNYTLAA